MTEVLWAFIGALIPPVAGNLGKCSGTGST